nr:MAG TPA: hypothetical protein [Caudoviricetes sp.]
MEREELQAIVGAERRNVPQCNWKNYDLECADYIDAIVEQPEQFEELTSALWNRMQQHRQRDLSSVPPALLRLEGESVEEWLNRCYAAAGYGGGC